MKYISGKGCGITILSASSRHSTVLIEYWRPSTRYVIEAVENLDNIIRVRGNIFFPLSA